MKSSATKLKISNRDIQEVELLAPLRALFPKPSYRLIPGVRVNDRQIDAVFEHRDTARMVAVEMKIKNWRRALEQAAVYQLFTRTVYVAIWHRYWNSERLPLFKRYGVGVILIRPTEGKLRARYVSKPTHGITPNRHYAKQLRTALRRGMS